MASDDKNIPLSKEAFELLKGQSDWSADVRKDMLQGWRYSANAYQNIVRPKTPVVGIPDGGYRVPIEFEKTEQKRHQLFYQLPALKLRAHPRTAREAVGDDPNQPRRDLKKAIQIYREVLARVAGPKGANTKAAMDEVIFDVLCPSGIGFVKVGYERFEDGQVLIPTGMQIPDPNFQQPGAVMGIAGVAAEPPLIPEMLPGPNVVAERYYASRISPALALVPPEFRGSDYDDADWLGHDFDLSDADAKARKWLTTANGKAVEGGRLVDDDTDRIVALKQPASRAGKHRFRELFYYAARFDAKVKHPEKIRRLVFGPNSETPVVHEDLKDQKWDGRGRLIGGLKKHPIKVLTLRYVSDLPFPPSDCAVARRLIDELAEFRTQMVIHRRKAVPMEWINISAVTNQQVKDALLKGDEYYGKVPTDGPGDKLMGGIPRAPYPHENRIAADMILSDINRLFSLGANSSSVTESGSTTATEIAAIERATATRLSGEREAVVQFWIKIVEALGSLVQLYADREDFIEIVGEDGAKEIEAWDRETIAGDFLYDAVPDSSMPPDGAADRDQALNWYNLTANDQYFDGEQQRRELAEAYGRDPDRLVKKPEPTPPTPPDPIKVSVSMKLEDLLPGSPLAEIGAALLSSANVSVSATTDTGEAQPDDPIKPAPVVDKERLRMAEADNQDQRAGGLVGPM